MNKNITVLLLFSSLAINAMEVGTSSYLEAPSDLVQRLQNAQSNRDKALPKELFGMVSKELATVKLVKIAASLKELYACIDRDLFNSVASYLIEQLIQCNQDASTLDKWFREENEHEKNIKEILTTEFNRQKRFQLVHLFTEKPHRHLRPLISSGCLSDEMKEIIYSLDSNDNPQYVKNLHAHANQIKSIAITRDNHIVTGSGDKAARVWNPDGSCITTLTGHTDWITSIAITHDNHIVTGSWDKTAKIWSLDGSCIATLTGHTDWITSVAITSDNHIVTGSYDNSAKVWNLDGSCIATLTGHTGRIKSIAITSDNHIVTGSYDSTAKIWNPDGKCIATLTGHTEITSVATTSDNHIVTGSYDKTAKVWDLPKWLHKQSNLTLNQLTLINYLDLCIKQGIKFAPKSTREAADSLPPLIRKNIEKRIALPTKASTAPCTIL